MAYPHTKKLTIAAIIFFLSAILVLKFKDRYSINPEIKALREITIRDPLFYDPSLNISALNKSILNLESQEKKFLENRSLFLNSLEESQQDLFPTNEKLFPIEFLSQLSDVSLKTDKFIKNPNSQSAVDLIDSYRKATNRYKTEVSSKLKIAKNILNRDHQLGNKEIRFIGVSTSLSTVINDLELIKRNATALDQEIANRELCLQSSNCNFEIKTSNPIDRKMFIPKNGSDFEIPVNLLKPDNTDDVLGPFFIQTSCWNKDKYQPIYIFYNSASGNITNLQTKLADQIYYVNYEKLVRSSVLANIYLNQGIKYGETNATSDYRCPDLTYKPELFERLREKLKKGRTLDKQELIIARQNKLWGLPYILNNIAFTLEPLALEEKITKQATDPSYLITARLDYSIFFMPFAKSVWRINDKPDYYSKKNIPFPEFLETYSSLKTKGYGDEEIKKFSIPHKTFLTNIIEGK